MTAQCVVTDSKITCPTAALAPGSHAVRLQVMDNSGNLGQVDQTVVIKPPKA